MREVIRTEMPTKDAVKSGIIGTFQNKYGERV